MKKIMFCDRFGLTEAVLNGSKTQTRRVITPQPTYSERTGINWKGYMYGRGIYDFEEPKASYKNFTQNISIDRRYKGYKVGELVAIAQSYEELERTGYQIFVSQYSDKDAGWKNKMFVAADPMPNFIRITNIRIERLQDISEENCIKEGVLLNTRQYEYDGTKRYCVDGIKYWRGIGLTQFDTAREAYAALIDKVSGKGTWDSNPFVWVYDFELIK